MLNIVKVRQNLTQELQPYLRYVWAKPLLIEFIILTVTAGGASTPLESSSGFLTS